jgi:formylglycine-generating enzyme required for sulfatase activity
VAKRLVAAPSPLNDGSIGKQVIATLPGGVSLTLCYCPAGSFTMGSPASEAGRAENEAPSKVTISQPFWLARTIITQTQWTSLMGRNTSHFKGDHLPVENVSWERARDFIQRLNSRVPAKGWKWALPTEAQWEYACRAGTRTPFYFRRTLHGKDANCQSSYPVGTEGPALRKTSAVCRYAANAWGLYDMHGNVYEWCNDAWDGFSKLSGGTDPLGTSGALRVNRGGSWRSLPEHCRAAFRNKNAPNHKFSNLGFRPAVVPDIAG